MARRFDGPYLLLRGEDPEAAEVGKLVAEIGAEQLGTVRVDRETDLVAPERVEDPAELVPAGHDPRVDVGRGAHFEDDPPLPDHGQRARIVGGLDPVPDA